MLTRPHRTDGLFLCLPSWLINRPTMNTSSPMPTSCTVAWGSPSFVDTELTV